MMEQIYKSWFDTIMKSIYYALYSKIQETAEKVYYTGLDIHGKPFTATEFSHSNRQSYWPDGQCVALVYKNEWHEMNPSKLKWNVSE